MTTVALGADRWKASKAFYAVHTLSQSGDAVEKSGSLTLKVATSFPHYERFWRFHICPATSRPNGIETRPNAADIISIIAQRSYTVFVYLVDAMSYLNRVEGGDHGPHDRNYYTALMYAGNALQVFGEFEIALGIRKGKDLGSVVKTLAAEIGVALQPYGNRKAHRLDSRERVITYRNYLTHQGRFFVVSKQIGETRKTFVIKPDALNGGTYGWTNADRDYAAKPGDWIPIVDMCRQTIDDTIAFLDHSYEQICNEMDRLLPSPRYQSLWGWDANQPIPMAFTGVSVGPVNSTIANGGSTIAGSQFVEIPPGAGSGVRNV